MAAQWIVQFKIQGVSLLYLKTIQDQTGPILIACFPKVCRGIEIMPVLVKARGKNIVQRPS